ncbi:hypothetical protein D9613_003507 [Agrocybe pediades]|uniref:Monooxygenase n=1 Tax=Agrocybe pediades TaxID=84607 RepID=A0A8H4QQU1_9AGAR|nr:hypothetical protein D9613_003507 [Agrocybe pediades]
MSTNEIPRRTRVAIIGAGPGGLSCAIALKRQLNLVDFVIYEKGSEVGGTWRDNTYPGCSSDIQMSFFSLSTDLQDWKSSHGSQEDILEYWLRLARKYDLYPHVIFNHKVTSADWDPKANCYHIASEDVRIGKIEPIVTTADVVISAIGVLETPRFARIPGFDTFKGEVFHSARWNDKVELRGKRVGVIGNGASATQFVPIISQDPEVNVLQFCRTAHWLLPNIRHNHSSARRWITRNVPPLRLLERWASFLQLEFLYTMVWSNSVTRWLFEKLLLGYLKYSSPKVYYTQLTPTFPLGCKRIIFDTGYTSALHRPNLDLNWDGIEKIVENGVVTKKGETIPLDVLIFATGFAADVYPLKIRGPHQTIQDYYEESEGPQAYMGTTAPGFPNFFTIFGPNTGTGWTSVIYTNEIQINYTLQLIKPILDGTIQSIEVTKEATDAYNSKIHGRLENTQYTQCSSWYRVGQEGKIVNIFPGYATLFWVWLRTPNWNHYTSVGADRCLRTKRIGQAIQGVVHTALAVGIVAGGAYYAYQVPVIEEAVQSGLRLAGDLLRGVIQSPFARQYLGSFSDAL